MASVVVRGRIVYSSDSEVVSAITGTVASVTWAAVRMIWLTHPNTCRGGGESNSRPLTRKSDALTTKQSHYPTGNVLVHK